MYIRISEDRDGDEAGIGRQEQDCRKLAKTQGWSIAEVYPENDVSAFKRRKVRLPDGTTALRVVRPEFRRLLEDLASGAIDALVAYDLDRVARDPRDLEDLIDVVEQHHIPTRAVTGSLDLSTDSGILAARINVAVANKSSRDTGRRVARKHEELAEQGKFQGGGKVRYGYLEDRVTVNEEQAAVVKEIAGRILGEWPGSNPAGDSLRQIAMDLTRRGIPTATNSPRGWHMRSVHSVITKPHVAGLRPFRGEIVGEADWPAILDRDTWERVCLKLEERKGEGQNQLVRWLNKVLLCGQCGHRLHGWSGHRGRPRYWCANANGLGGCGVTTLDGLHAEDAIERLILKRLSDPAVVAEFAESSSSGSVRSARDEVKQDEAQMKELATAWARRQISMAEYLAARKEIEGRLAKWSNIVKAATPGPVRSLLAADDLRAGWEALNPHGKRAVAMAVCPYGIRVDPPGTKNGFDPSRLHRLREPL